MACPIWFGSMIRPGKAAAILAWRRTSSANRSAGCRGSVILFATAGNTHSPVQLTRDVSTANLIRAWESGRVRVADRWLEGHVIVAPDRIIETWDVESPATLGAADLAPAVELAPEIILLGTGNQVTLPDLDLMAALAERAIGLEIMSTPAACRTFNVLVNEQRRVVAALFNFDSSGPRV